MEVTLRIKRQDSSDTEPYWEEFNLQASTTDNVISLLMMVQENPDNCEGVRCNPVAWECACLEDVCGACSMRINGTPRQACSALVSELGGQITLEPMSRFPVIRDLIVNRRELFESLKRVKAWAPGETLWDASEGPKILPEDQKKEYAFSKCFTCGICLEVCPVHGGEENFIGALAVGQAHRHNINPLGAKLKDERIEALTNGGNIDACDNDLSCHKACPKGVPLKEALESLKNASQWSWF